MDSLDTSHNQMAKPITGFQCLTQLANVEGIFIKQKFEKFEAITGCETPNVYTIYAANHEGDKIESQKLFKAKEKSECCQRICLPYIVFQSHSGDCRKFDLKVKSYSDKFNMSHDGLVMQFKREYKCTFMCLNRPVMDVTLVQGHNVEMIGRVLTPFMCCDKAVHILGRGDELRYKIVADCCQLGIFCPLPCDACQKIRFEVRNASGEFVSELWKVSPGFCQACCSPDTDCFKIPFTGSMSAEDRALMLAATLLIDYSFFEVNQDEKRATKSIEHP